MGEGWWGKMDIFAEKTVVGWWQLRIPGLGATNERTIERSRKADNMHIPNEMMIGVG